MRRSEVLTVEDVDVDDLPNGTASIVRLAHPDPDRREWRLATVDDRGRFRSLDDDRDLFARDTVVEEVLA